ncbi:hypothetical protein A3742_05375 [Oleiphilus sp. HI0071]|uniref:SurA N-terminal domain-containing protein n=1 Tax=Oleiphilus sp. HI0080 TaxID=1822255 RepID=UPI0007C34A5B|nr:SurA N-terminal domain-containing protein [Oleiphilus sp. HI0080]KZY62317.1 hypothetical protein A3737_04895 [Oleiphilus sp. HI0065]KZY85499.1 hypothetical protein A3742_05375 [Oleiphilus sp. HI0071]KZY99743.1 hypothetical protein A3744_12525 [Oleiphilus sp. HI0073]KZZ48128.1 hypothetical protein A3760_03575 [Oleiphilus sp. HI0122]KZZ78544.1 hypothetical protein A3767_12800 [Oleiphilus sp. HI0133]
MLQDVRQGMQGTTAKVIVWGIAITFALFGVESIVGGIGGEPDVVEVNGEGIPESEFKIAVERKKRQLLMQMGEAADPDLIDDGLLSQSVLDGLVQEKTLEQDANDKGLYISVAMVDEYIRGMNEFQVDGEFSNQRMQSVLGSAGFTLNSFRDSLAKQFVIDQSRTGLIGSAFVLESEENALVKLDRQTRTFGMTVLSADEYKDEIEITDAEIQSYYNENASMFVQPENVDVSYVVLRKSELDQIDVASEEVEARYELELQDFVGDEQRRASHILVSISDEVTEEEALAKVTELKTKIDAGEDFSVLAKENSDDEGSAVDGGDLGFSGKGVYVSGFEDALFSMEEGAVSEPVKTEFGYHLIKLLEVQVNEPPELAERAPVLEAEILAEKRDQQYVDLVQQLADISYSSPDLVDPADELGLELQQRIGVSAESQDEIFSELKVQRALFSDENLSGEHNSEVIELDEGLALVFKVEDYHEASTKSLEQVRDEVTALLTKEKAGQYAASIGNAFIVRAEAGEHADLVAEDMSFAWEQKVSVRRDDFSVNPDLLFKVFSMDKPAGEQPVIGGFELSNGDYAVVSLTAVSSGSLEDITMIEKQSIKSSLGASYGGTDYASYLTSIEESAIVERM